MASRKRSQAKARSEASRKGWITRRRNELRVKRASEIQKPERAKLKIEIFKPSAKRRLVIAAAPDTLQGHLLNQRNLAAGVNDLPLPEEGFRQQTHKTRDERIYRKNYHLNEFLDEGTLEEVHYQMMVQVRKVFAKYDRVLVHALFLSLGPELVGSHLVVLNSSKHGGVLRSSWSSTAAADDPVIASDRLRRMLENELTSDKTAVYIEYYTVRGFKDI